MSTSLRIAAITLIVAAGVFLPANANASAPIDPIASGLAFVPADAPIVVHVRGVERTKERLTTMLNKAAPDFAPGATGMIDSLLQAALEGRKLQGLIKDGSVFLAFLSLPNPNGDVPPWILVARVSRYAEFRDGFLSAEERKNVATDPSGFERCRSDGRDLFFVDRKDYAAFTLSKEAATLLAKKPEGLAAKLDGEIARGLLNTDFSIYVNLTAVIKDYGAQIREFRQMMGDLLGALPAGGAAEKASMEMAKRIYDGMFQVIEDGRAALMGLDFRPEGLNLHLQALIAGESTTNKFLKEMKPAAFPELGTLPSGLMVYTASKYSPTVFKMLAPMIYGMMGSEGETKSKLENAIEMLASAGNTATIAANNVPPSGVEVMFCENPVKAAAAQLQLFRAMGDGASFQSAYIKGQPEVKENAQEYKGFKLHHASLTWDLDRLGDALPAGGDAMKAAIKKLLGEGTKTWFGTDGRRYLVVTAQDWSAAQSKIDAYLEGRRNIAGESVFKSTREQLPAEASVYYFVDAGKYANVMADYALAIFKAMPVLPLNLPNEFKPVPTEVTFVGAAIALKAEHAAFDLFVPVAAVQEVRKVIMPLLQGGAN